VALTGNNLAKSVRPNSDKTTLQAVCESCHVALQTALASFSVWDNFETNGAIDEINREVLVLLDPSMVEPARSLITDSLGLWSQTSAYVDSSDDPPTQNLIEAVQILASNCSGNVALVDSLFHTSVASELSDGIVAEAGDLSDKVGNLASKVLGNVLGGVWWVIAGGLGLLYIWHKWGGNKLLS